jgi:hypothetical protein
VIFFLGLLEAFILGSLTALVLDLLAGLRSLLAACSQFTHSWPLFLSAYSFRAPFSRLAGLVCVSLGLVLGFPVFGFY